MVVLDTHTSLALGLHRVKFTLVIRMAYERYILENHGLSITLLSHINNDIIDNVTILFLLYRHVQLKRSHL